MYTEGGSAMVCWQYHSTLNRVVLFAVLLGGCSIKAFSDLVLPDAVYEEDSLSRFERDGGSGVMDVVCNATENWNFALANETSSVSCDHFVGFGAGTAKRYCNESGDWGEVDYSNCSLYDLWKNITTVSMILDSENSTAKGLTEGISFLGEVYAYILNSEGLRLPKMFFETFATLFNYILHVGLSSNAKDELMMEEAVTLLNSAEVILGSLDIDATVNITEPYIGFYGHFYSNWTSGMRLLPDDFQLQFNAATFEISNMDGAVDIQFVYYALNGISQLFSTNMTSGKDVVVDLTGTLQLVSNVVSAQICSIDEEGDCKTITNNGIVVNIRFNLTVPIDKEADYYCAFWDATESTSQWVVERMGEVEEGQVLCKVDHLTAFAVVESVKTPNTGGVTALGIPLLVAAPLYAGGAFAIVLLLGTIAFFISLRKELCSKPSNFVHLNISLALLLSFSLLCTAINGGGGLLNNYACEAFSFFLHWFSLAPASWSLCEGLLIANTLLWKPVSDKNLLRGLSALGWAIPLVIAIISIAAGHPNYLIVANDKILGCWLPAQNGIYWSFVVPILFSAVLFIVLLIVIIALWFRVRLWGIIELSSSEEWELLKINAKLTGISSLIMLLYIITFMLGLIALNAPSNVLSYLFCIASVILVIVVVILYVVCNDKDYGGMKYRAVEAFKTYCFGSRKRIRGRSRAQEVPASWTMEVQLQTMSAVPNVYVSTDMKETADLGKEGSDSIGNAKQDTSE